MRDDKTERWRIREELKEVIKEKGKEREKRTGQNMTYKDVKNK